MNTTEILNMNLTDFLNEVKQDLKNAKYQFQLADLCIISDIDMGRFLQRMTDNFDLKKLQTVYNDIGRWEFHVSGGDTDAEEPYITKQIKGIIIDEGYNHAYNETCIKLKKDPDFTDSYIENLEKIEKLDIENLEKLEIEDLDYREYCSNPLIYNIICGYYDALGEFGHKMKIVNENTKQPQQIILPDNILNELEQEKMIASRKPLQWNKKKIALCAYFVDCYFSKSDPTDLWKIGQKLFNVSNLRQSKYNYLNNERTQGKPKNHQIIDRILQHNG
jgi:hypothetical protein